MSSEIVLANYCLGGQPLGIELTADDRGLTACRMLPPLPRTELASGNRFLRLALNELCSYFSGVKTPLTARALPDGTEFQQDVWLTTATIPYGEVRSYAWIAQKIGRPKAVRAVAQALGANPLLLYVPCHRVVRSNGELGGFSCGLKWKVLLLALEGMNADKLPAYPAAGTATSEQPRFLL